MAEAFGGEGDSQSADGSGSGRREGLAKPTSSREGRGQGVKTTWHIFLRARELGAAGTKPGLKVGPCPAPELPRPTHNVFSRWPTGYVGCPSQQSPTAVKGEGQKTWETRHSASLSLSLFLRLLGVNPLPPRARKLPLLVSLLPPTPGRPLSLPASNMGGMFMGS